MPRLIAENLITHIVQRRGDTGPHLARAHPPPSHHWGIGQAERRTAWPAADQRRVEQATEIGHVDLLGARRLRQCGVRAGSECGLDQQPDDLDISAWRDDHSLWAESAVIQAKAVYASKRVGDLAGDPCRLKT